MKCFYALLAFIPTLAFSQISIEGHIVDANTNEALIGAHVYLLTDWQNGAVADVKGKFDLTITNMADSILISYMGYEEKILPVKREIGVISLVPKVLVGEDVVVTAVPLVAEEFKYLTINKLDIYTNPSARADPILAVNSLPSSTTTDESANISLRGSSAIETGTFLNNVPIYDAVRYAQLNGIGTFSLFNTAIVKDVSVFPGNPPLEFGNSTSGVISLTTDDQQMEGNTNSVTVSLASIGYFREQKLTDRQSLKLFTNWQPSGAIKALNEAALSDIEKFESGDVGVYWYGNTPGLAWKVLGYGLLEGYMFNFRHPSYVGLFDQNKRRGFVNGTMELPFSGGTLTYNNGISSSRGAYSYSNAVFEVATLDLFQGINFFKGWEKWVVKTGVAFDLRSNRTDGNFHQYEYALAEHHPTVPYKSRKNINAIEVFGYAKYFLGQNYVFGSGLRKNLNHQKQHDYLSKQLNASYLGDHISVIVGAGHYHKYGFYENTDSPFYAENKQLSMDVNYTWTRSDVSVSGFTKRAAFDNQKYRVRGVELFANHRWSTRFTASTSITLLDAYSESRDSYLYDINYFLRANGTYRTPQSWSVQASITNRQGTLIEIVSRSDFNEELQVFQPVYGGGTERLSDYFNLGLSVSKILYFQNEQSLVLFLNINNVPDYENIRTRSYSADYGTFRNSLFSQRTIYMGGLFNF